MALQSPPLVLYIKCGFLRIEVRYLRLFFQKWEVKFDLPFENDPKLEYEFLTNQELILMVLSSGVTTGWQGWPNAKGFILQKAASL